MAKNRIFANGRYLTLTPTTVDAINSSDFVSGQPIMVGVLPGICLNNMTTAREVTIDTEGVYALTVFRPTTVGVGGVGSLVFWNPTAVGTTIGRVALPSGTTVAPSTGSQPFGVMLTAIAAANSSANSTGIRVKLISPSQVQSSIVAT